MSSKGVPVPSFISRAKAWADEGNAILQEIEGFAAVIGPVAGPTGTTVVGALKAAATVGSVLDQVIDKFAS